MLGKKERQEPTVRSLDRGLAILQAIASTERSMSLGEVAELMNIDRSTAFRLLQTLKRRGFLAVPAGKKDYILGSAIWVLHNHYNWNKMFVKVASEQLKQLAAATNETAHIATREGSQALFVDCAAASHIVSVSSRIGELLPLYCTAHGKALLTDAKERDLKALYGTRPLKKYTDKTIATLPDLAKDLATIRELGYAVDDAEFANELRCIAAPIRLNGEIVGSVGISAPILRVTPAANQANAESVLRIAQKIGEILGGLQHEE